MSGLVIKGQQIEIPRVDVLNFLDDPELRPGREDYQARRPNVWVRGIVLHTRWGVEPVIKDKLNTKTSWRDVYGKRQRASSRKSSAHITIHDRQVGVHLDLQDDQAYHAGQVNEVTVGIEMYQTKEGHMTMATMDTTMDIVDAVTRHLGIQRQVWRGKGIHPEFTSGNPLRGKAFQPGGKSGKEFVGVYGHRNCTRSRGLGDPGGAIFSLLAGIGYESVTDIDDNRLLWSKRQRAVGIPDEDIDGIPGPQTLRAILASHNSNFGMWVQQPSDCKIGD